MKQVLIVDDEEELAQLMADVLGTEECSITHCKNGAEALETCRKQKFDTIFSDVKMPEMDGVEFVTNLRANSMNQDTKFFFVTAYADDATLEKAQSHNIEIIEKPFDVEVIYEKIMEDGAA